MADEVSVLVDRLHAVRDEIKFLQDTPPGVIPQAVYVALSEIEVLLGIVSPATVRFKGKV